MARSARDSMVLAVLLLLLPGAEVHATEAAVGPDAPGEMPGAMPPGGPMMNPMAGMPGAMPGFPGAMPGAAPGGMPGGMPFPMGGGMPGMGAPGMPGMPGMPATGMPGMPAAAQEAQGLSSLSAKSNEVVTGMIESFFHKNKLNKTELQCLEEGTGKLAGNFMMITSHSIKLLQQIFGLKSHNGLEGQEPPRPSTTTTTVQDKADLVYYYKDGLQQATPAGGAVPAANVTTEAPHDAVTPREGGEATPAGGAVPAASTTTAAPHEAVTLHEGGEDAVEGNTTAAGTIASTTEESQDDVSNPAGIFAVRMSTGTQTPSTTEALEASWPEGGAAAAAAPAAPAAAGSASATAQRLRAPSSRTRPRGEDPASVSLPGTVSTPDARRPSAEPEAVGSATTTPRGEDEAPSRSPRPVAELDSFRSTLPPLAVAQLARPTPELGSTTSAETATLPSRLAMEMATSSSTTLLAASAQASRRLASSADAEGSSDAGADAVAVGMPGMMGGMPGMGGLEESGGGLAAGGAMGGAMMVLSASALFMELGVSLQQVVRLSHDIVQECVQKDARDALKLVSEHIRSVKYLGGHIMANGANIMQELADAVEAFQHGDHRKFGNDLGDALRLVFLSNQTTALLPEGVPEEEVLENMTAGMIDGFFGEGFALDLRVGDGKLMHIDLHQCMAENVVFFQSIWSSIMCFFAQRAAEHNALAAKNHNKLTKKQVAHMRQKDRAEFGTAIGVTMVQVPAALRRCNISKREEAMLLDSIKGFGNGLTFGVHVPGEEAGVQKDDVTASIAQTVHDFKGLQFYTFGNDIGKLLQLMVLSMFPQKYTVDASGKLQTQLLGASEGADGATLSLLGGRSAAFQLLLALLAVPLGGSFVVAHCRHARTRGGASWRALPTGPIFSRAPRAPQALDVVAEATDPILQRQAVEC